jgi:lycopene beta-cyclase
MPVFNSDEATLMDFIEDQTHPVSFMYELPTSRTKALLEYTVFSSTCIAPESLEPLLEKIISERLAGKAFRINRTEKGVIPMGLADQSQTTNQRWLKAGLISGAARPSTGYAFLRIQRWARSCSEKLRSQAEIGLAHKDPIITSTMDRIFLNVLAMTPHHASSLFFDLFKNTPTPSLIRFLNDEGRYLDHILVILSLPKLPFIRRLF